jgi:hypothetical protein
MTDGSDGSRRPRARKRGFVAMAVLTATMALLVPVAGALLSLNLTLPLISTPPSSPVTVAVGPLDVSANHIDTILDIPGGLTQTASTVTQLLTGLQGGAAVAAPFVQAHATEAAQTAIENLQARAEATAAAALALDTTTAQEELAAIATDLQGQAMGEVAGVLPLALTTGLQVVQNIVTPLCSLTAVPTSFIPGVGVDTTRLWTAAAPVIQQTDQGTNKLLRDTWSTLYDQTLASVASIPTAGPILSALLLLLKFNWTTTYNPPNGGTPIVQSTKALMNVPTPIDVDQDGLFDLCGTMSFALTGSGSSISGLKFTQTITKMPLAKPVLPVQIGGGLLNVLNFGYDTRESTVPVVYTTAATLDSANGAILNIDNTYAVHRGMNLTIPPASLAALSLGVAPLTLPTLLPITTPAPKPIITQEVCIASCSTLAIRDRFENVPATTHVHGPLASAGVNTNYSAPSTSDSFTHSFGVGTTITLSASAGRDRTTPEVATPIVSSAPTAFASCLSISDGTCAANTAAGDQYSTSFTASSPTFAEQNFALTSLPAATCPTTGALSVSTHVTGTSMNFALKRGAAAAGSGRVALDSAGQPIDGTICVGSTLALAGYPSATFPVGTAAANRVATYHQSGFSQPVPDSKTGSITCPTGTAISYNASAIFPMALAPVLCFLKPVAAVPTITGQALIDATLTAVPGAWSPAAPNAPALSYQWNKCSATGTGCTPISGATASTYVLDYGNFQNINAGAANEPTDWHHKFTVTVTGTNLDGTDQATSAPTALVELPPPPTILTAPVLSANRKVGVVTTTTNGTYNNGATTFAYKWQRCDAAGTAASCVDIVGATTSSYLVAPADKGLSIRSGVLASNHGGSAPINYSATALIPGDPTNISPPGMKNGPANAVGASVATGDTLAAVNGLWIGDTDPFTYQWQRCDAAGTPASCVNIVGATGATYQLAHPADDGSTIRVMVTAHGLNGSTSAPSGVTGVVLFNDLAAKTVTQIPDGTVNATVAGAGTTTYVGGAFDTVGAPTGGSGRISDSGVGNTVTAASQTAGAANGGVTATVPDGSGGYFLGGSFTQVKGIQCPGLAHLDLNGIVDQDYCFAGLTGTVRSLARTSGGTAASAPSSKVLVVGGDFTLPGGSNLMFLDPANPTVPVFTTGGSPNGVVKALATNNTNNNVVYVGGQFNQAAGTNAGNLAGIQLTWTAGQLTAAARNGWLPGVCIGTPATTSCGNANASVNTLAWLSTGVVLAGGRFDTQYRANANTVPSNATGRNNVLMMADNGNAGVNGWNPNVQGGNQTVNAIAIGAINGFSNVPIYIGGDFLTIGGQNIKNLGEFGSTFLGTSVGNGTTNASGPMNNWLPSPNAPVTSLAWAGNASASSLIVGGAFTTINSGAPATTLVRHRLAKITIGGSTSSTLPVVDGTWDPNAGRTVRAVSRDTTAGTVLVGGDFVVLGGQTRNNLAEFDPNTGVTGWNPSADGTVNALAFRGGKVYAGGSFSKIGAASRANLAEIDGASGVATASWNPGTDGVVKALATDASNVYVGGDFSNVGAQPRADLAAIDGSGTVTSWNPGTDTGSIRAIAVSGGTVYVGGNFNQVDGAPRNNVAAVDGNGDATGFDPNANAPVNAIAVNSGGVYLGGDFTAVGGGSRDHVALINPLTSVAEGWNPGVDGTVNAVFLIGSQVFVGGSFGNAGGATRTNLAALDAGSDSALLFAPNPNGTVFALTRTSGGSIVVGGSFAIIAGQAAPALGFFGG